MMYGGSNHWGPLLGHPGPTCGSGQATRQMKQHEEYRSVTVPKVSWWPEFIGTGAGHSGMNLVRDTLLFLSFLFVFPSSVVLILCMSKPCSFLPGDLPKAHSWVHLFPWLFWLLLLQPAFWGHLYYKSGMYLRAKCGNSGCQSLFAKH